MRESISLDEARLLLCLARERHFGRAAEHLGWRQPQASKGLRALEARLGVQLVARTSRRVALTEAGQALIEPLRAWLREGEGLTQIARAAAQGLRGQLRVGMVSPAGFGPLPQWLRRFKSMAPEVDLVLQEATLDVQLQALQAGEMDVGWVLQPEGAAALGLATRRVAVEPMVLAVPSALAERLGPAPAWAAVLAQPLVLFPREIAPALHDAVLNLYRREGVDAQPVQRAVQMATLIHLVSADFGLAWVPESMQALQREGVVYWPAPPEAPRCETWMLWRAPARPVVQRFVDSLPLAR
jgi:DNA-binding transcriptional LysR family regulator